VAIAAPIPQPSGAVWPRPAIRATLRCKLGIRAVGGQEKRGGRLGLPVRYSGFRSSGIGLIVYAMSHPSWNISRYVADRLRRGISVGYLAVRSASILSSPCKEEPEQQGQRDATRGEL
jgi:hypothetical protein